MGGDDDLEGEKVLEFSILVTLQRVKKKELRPLTFSVTGMSKSQSHGAWRE